jgi:hypothetical protein
VSYKKQEENDIEQRGPLNSNVVEKATKTMRGKTKG